MDTKVSISPSTELGFVNRKNRWKLDLKTFPSIYGSQPSSVRTSFGGPRNTEVSNSRKIL